MDRCPNCHARLDGTDQCRRCGLELGVLQAVVAAAERHLMDAAQCLVDGDHSGAAHALEEALALTGDPLAAALLDFARAPRGPSTGSAVATQPEEVWSNAGDPEATPVELDAVSSSVGAGGG